MTALRELRKRVKAGEFPADMSNIELGWDVPILTPYEAFSGSIDAAKTLHEAMLPGWKWVVWASHSGPNFGCNLLGPISHDSVYSVNPARAWLLAILDALIEKEKDDDGRFAWKDECDE